MQINNILPTSSIAPDLGAGPHAAKSNLRQSAGEDQVQISSLASKLSADPSKLSQLQTAYEQGNYKVSPSQIANSILNDAMLS